MFGWDRRVFFPFYFFYMPSPLWGTAQETNPWQKWGVALVGLLLTFAIAVQARLLELPYWEDPAFLFQGEHLLATHDAYHWIAGAEGFEFGAGHPMSVLAKLVATVCGTSPAEVGFWLPAVLCGVFAVSVFLWGLAFDAPFSGLCAGVLASLSPAFFARTLLGFYDTDLVILTFAVLLGLMPAIWLSPWLITPAELAVRFFLRHNKKLSATEVPAYVNMVFRRFLVSVFVRWVGVADGNAEEHGKVSPLEGAAIRPAVLASALSLPVLMGLILAGWFGYWMQDWHSLFPYLVRFLVVMTPLLIVVLGPRGGRDVFLHGAVCHVLPLLLGFPGVILALGYALFLQKYFLPCERGVLLGTVPLEKTPWRKPLWLYALWAVIVILACDMTVFENMLASFWSYVDRSGDVISKSREIADPVVFPSVAQSIIEVQQVKFTDILSYLYPEEILVWLGFFFFFVALLIIPSFIWFVPFVALSLLSLKMGGRMSMFGSPALLLPLCLIGGFILEQAFVRLLCVAGMTREGQAGQRVFRAFSTGIYFFSGQIKPLFTTLKLCCSLYFVFMLTWPLIKLIPELTQGPIISAQQAEGLQFIKEHTPEDSVVWNWWDWGYATHHFARRSTIADGARHNGPALYLPAAVYTTSDPRFARQLIKYTASRGNLPGNVFTDLSAPEAQALMTMLRDHKTPLIETPGKQYLVVSFELMRLGVWVTKYGSWNFTTKDGAGALMNNVFQPLDFNMELGTIVAKDGGQAVLAGSIDLLEPDGVKHRLYPHKGGYHFLFNLEDRERAEIMIMDTAYYNSLMVQLMLAPSDDPRFTPYFKLVFDNVYTRVYEVR